jgi:hypothetical protein
MLPCLVLAEIMVMSLFFFLGSFVIVAAVVVVVVIIVAKNNKSPTSGGCTLNTAVQEVFILAKESAVANAMDEVLVEKFDEESDAPTLLPHVCAVDCL